MIRIDLRPASVFIFHWHSGGGGEGQLEDIGWKTNYKLQDTEEDDDDNDKVDNANVDNDYNNKDTDNANLWTVMIGKARLASWRRMKLTPSLERYLIIF